MRILASFITSLLFLVFILVPIFKMGGIARLSLSANSINASPHAIGDLIFSDHLLPFEVLSLALLAAMIGAIFIAKE